MRVTGRTAAIATRDAQGQELVGAIIFRSLSVATARALRLWPFGFVMFLSLYFVLAQHTLLSVRLCNIWP